MSIELYLGSVDIFYENKCIGTTTASIKQHGENELHLILSTPIAQLDIKGDITISRKETKGRNGQSIIFADCSYLSKTHILCRRNKDGYLFHAH